MKHTWRALSSAAMAGMAAFALACTPGGSSPDPTPVLDMQSARTVTAAPPAASPSATPLPVLPKLDVYTVKSGDYPMLIAEAAGVPQDEREGWVKELLALNGVDETGLQIGQKLILPPAGLRSSSSPRPTPRAGNAPASVVDPSPTKPASTPTPHPAAHIGPPPFAATPPFVAFITPVASPTSTPKPTIAPGTRAWLTSSDDAALYYYCDLDSGWTNIPADKLLAFDSEQQLLAIWGRFRTKAPDSKC